MSDRQLKVWLGVQALSAAFLIVVAPLPPHHYWLDVPLFAFGCYSIRDAYRKWKELR